MLIISHGVQRNHFRCLVLFIRQSSPQTSVCSVNSHIYEPRSGDCLVDKWSINFMINNSDLGYDTAISLATEWLYNQLAS